MDPEHVADLIRKAMPEAQVSVRSPDQTHFEALVVSERFAGKPTLQRHRAVYAALGALVGAEIHALSLRTLTTEERDAQA